MEKNWTTGSVGKSILRYDPPEKTRKGKQGKCILRSGPLRLHPRTLPGLR